MTIIYLGLLSIIVGEWNGDDDCINVDAGWKYASGVSILDWEIVIVVKESIINCIHCYFQRLRSFESHC